MTTINGNGLSWRSNRRHQGSAGNDTALLSGLPAPRRHPARLVLVAAVLVLLAMLVNSIVRNPNMQWPVVGSYFLSQQVLTGIVRTLALTATAIAISLILGTLLAVMSMSESRVIRLGSRTYVNFFRGSPVLIQVIVWFNLALLFPRIGIGIPFGPVFYQTPVNSFMTPLLAGILGLGLNEASYMSEVVRGGLLSVPAGQREAAKTIGLSSWQTLHAVVLPQAIRVMIPTIGNEVIGMLKTTSIVSVVAMPELLYSVELIYARTGQVVPLLVVALIWYLIITTILTIGQRYLERHFGRSVSAPRLGRPKGTPSPAPTKRGDHDR